MIENVELYYAKTKYDGKNVYISLEIFEIRFWGTKELAHKHTVNEWKRMLKRYALVNYKKMWLEKVE